MRNCCDCTGLTFTIEPTQQEISFSIEREQEISFSVGDRIVETGDYDKLIHKPSINGVVLEGDKTNEELFIVNDKHFEYRQLTPSAVWEVEHNLDKYPSVSIVDSAGTMVMGDVEYINSNKVLLLFQSAFSGKAFFN